ncbi:MAG: vWA domain-containing protein, partial [Chitinispirillaceae bacterium]
MKRQKKKKFVTYKRKNDPIDIACLLAKSREPLPFILLFFLTLALITGIFIKSRDLVTVATDFFEATPKERVGKMVSNESQNVEMIKKGADQTLYSGGGDPRSKITKKGVLGIVDGEIKGKSVAPAEILGKGGISTDIDAVLAGSGGLETEKTMAAHKGISGIGYGSGISSGFAGFKNQKKRQSRRYTPGSYQQQKQKRPDENTFRNTSDYPLSTFSIDVDNASYTYLVNCIKHNMLPSPDMIRIEELINNFAYDYPPPVGKHPISITSETGPCPWNSDNLLVRIGVKGRSLPPDNPPPSNFVFLVDVSGSMNRNGRLSIFKTGLRQFASTLKQEDRISIVTYAGKAGIHLNSTPGYQKEQIAQSIDKLEAAGSTAGSEGIHLAYRVANRNFIHQGNNRIIIATDGDFNVGTSGTEELVELIEKRKGGGIFLTVLGFDTDEENESKMEKLANRGDGNFASVYELSDLRKVFENVDENFFTVAQDVKIQVEFDEQQIKSYRLIGYENRMLQTEDFADDSKDAGEIGAEQNVTALYEIVPSDLLKQSLGGQLMKVNVRYKNNSATQSNLMSHLVVHSGISLASTSDDFRFAASVASLGLILRDSRHKGNATYDSVIDLALSGVHGGNPQKRYEFI